LKSSKYNPNATFENITEEINKQKLAPGQINNHDTIGMIAMDAKSRLSGACSTSGMAFKMSGRVGDSPIIGAGLFVDNEVGAATSTGVGEEVIKICGSHTVVELMRHGASPEEACKKAVERVVKRNGANAKTIQVAFIALNKKGEYGGYSLLPGFSFAVKSATIEKVIQSKSWFA
ncbi:MAG TPA: isoaspartyl peptidase/L-asparaginase, partial [Segetibacter sp.]